jgi:putative oxidoreductase
MTIGQRLRKIGAWLLQILMAAAFVSIGLGKFGDPSWERAFARWGYPPGSHLVVGALECLGGVLMLVPRFTSYAALFVAMIMVGAIATHALAGQPWTRPLPHLCVLLLLAVVRWRDRWRPSHAASSPGGVAAS